MTNLTCPSCGSPVSPSAEDLRRRAVVCGACQTPSGVTAEGLVPAAAFVRQSPPPEGLRVLDSAPGELRVSVRKSPSLVVLRGGDQVLLCIVALLLSVLFNSPGLGFAVLLCGGLLVGSLRRTLPPLHVTEDRIAPAVVQLILRLPPVSPGDIEQLYTVSKQLMFGPGVEPPHPCYGVWALCADGSRHAVADGVVSLEAALYLEGLIEGHLGLAERAVYGAAGREDAIPRSAGASVSPEAVPVRSSLVCSSCGAGVHVGQDARRRGTARCGYCNSITLTVALGTEEEPLGRPAQAPSFRSLRVEEEGAALVVRDAEGRRLLLELSRGRLSVAGGSYALSDLQAVHALPRPRDEVNPLAFWAGLIGTAEQWAFSGDFDFMGPEGGLGEDGPFTLYASGHSGRLYLLIPEIVDPWDAAQLRRLITRQLEEARGPVSD